MRKTFQLRPEGKNPDRVLEAVKHEIRKYIQREKRRDLPQGMDYWDFDCRFGADAESAEPVHPSALTASIDAVAAAAGPQFYVEILARPAKRGPRGERKVVEDKGVAPDAGSGADPEADPDAAP